MIQYRVEYDCVRYTLLHEALSGRPRRRSELVSAPHREWICQKKSHLPQGGGIGGRHDARYAGEIKATSIFGIKFCHFFAKTPQNEGMCVDVDENKRTKSVTS